MEAEILNFIEYTDNKIKFTIGNRNTICSRKIKSDGIFIKRGVTYQCDMETKMIEPIDGSVVAVEVEAKKQTPKAVKTLQSEFSINQRFEFLDKFTNMVLDGDTASIIVTGEGGLGKTHTVMHALKEKGLEELTDYFIIKGYATPKALYATLFENNGKTIIFDDCDSVLKDPTAINLLKGALDSYEKRTISWLQKGFVPDDLPASFEFNGNIIFISNMNASRLDGAVKSRSITIDLSMTIKDRIERMKHILPEILPKMSMQIKETALEYMEKHAAEAKEFNMRTLMKCSKVIKAYGLDSGEWEDAVKYLLTSV